MTAVEPAYVDLSAFDPSPRLLTLGTATTYAVDTESEVGKTFAVAVDKGEGGCNVFYIDGVEADWQRLCAASHGPVAGHALLG
jgi:hypothetical protein